MPLSDHQNLMARLANLGIQNDTEKPLVSEKPSVSENPSIDPVEQNPKVEQKGPKWEIAKTPKKRGAQPMNKNAKKQKIRDAVLTVRITKTLKNELVAAAKKDGKRTGGSGKLAPYVEMLLESAIEAEYYE